MYVFKGKTNLNEPVENFRLTKIFLILYFTFDVVAEVANFAILHDDY